jgi:acyl-coenzyme A thioesterase PaaI-like protein
MLSETGSPYANDLGVKWEPGEGDVSRVSLPFEEKNTMGGGLHGGAIASLVPLSTLGPRGGAVASGSTVSMHVCYVRAARKGVVARTRAVRRVRELSFFDTLVEGEDGSSIAYASSVVSESRAAPVAIPPWGGPPGAAAGAVDVELLRAAMETSAFLKRRQLRILRSGQGSVALALSAGECNLAADGTIHEGAALTLIDAAGATCPWTDGSWSPPDWGATIALSVSFVRPLPQDGLLARAAVRARDARVYWTDVTVTGARSGDVHAVGTVVYRFNKEGAA